jgi:HTH-type transcriptional regulator / antitoxin HigA
MPRSITSQADYESALERINELWSAEASTQEGGEYNALFEAVEQYEAEHFPIDDPESYAAVEYHLDRLNLSIDTLPISDPEKAILENCIVKQQAVPEWLLVKLSGLFGVPREILGREGSTQDTLHSHSKMQ